MTKNPFDDPQMQEFYARARKELAPKVASSGVGISILSGEIDPKLAIEVGYILLLGKPLVLVVMPGAKVPEGLLRASVGVLEWNPDGDEMGRRIKELLDRVGV